MGRMLNRVCSVLCRMLRGVHQALVWLLSVRYIHQFSIAFLPSLLARRLGAQYVHQFSSAGSCAYLAVYEQSWSFVEHAALKVKVQISSDISALSIDALLS